MEKDDLLKLTAWPEREEDATADALIVHGARLAMGWSAETRPLSARVFRMSKDDPEYQDAMRRYLDAMTATSEQVWEAAEAFTASEHGSGDLS